MGEEHLCYGSYFSVFYFSMLLASIIAYWQMAALLKQPILENI
ncbi:hypothetical protein SAMN05444128_0242 [Pontibacter indicus]|uniref:Uncharacterized protein n=1 Tax=Pontibacter indicus TaxID=1317125 RepID=A0A1R3WCS6_9BACT|nr:hypothetical protein SAMN05444128_0242 [Pontibacter indicus]